MTYAKALANEVQSIKAKLRRAGISESELARVAGLSQPHVHNVLSGVRRMTPSVADKLNKALQSSGD